MPDGARPQADTPFLELRGVVKRFGANTVLRSIDLTVGEHEVVSLIGASGSGKSTLLRCVNALEPIEEGTIALAPRQVLRLSRKEAERRADSLLERVGLQEKRGDYPDSLSGGQQQRVAIVRALAMQPKLLLLDEVTSALDPELVAEVLNIIRELAHEGMTMLLATHEMTFAREVSSRVCFLDDGVICEQGEPEQIFTEPTHPRTQTFLKRIIAAGRL